MRSVSVLRANTENFNDAFRGGKVVDVPVEGPALESRPKPGTWGSGDFLEEEEMKLFGPSSTIHASFNFGVGPLTFHFVPLDWRVWWHHEVLKFGGANISRRDYWVGPFRVQYITSEEVCLDS